MKGKYFRRSPYPRLRLDRFIRSMSVRLISSTGQNMGVVPTDKALKLAEEEGLNLIEISPNANPPVCKIMDYGKYKYELAKKKRESSKGSKHFENKEIRLRLRTDEHDLKIKLQKARGFIIDGDRVTITLRLRGREMERPEIATELIDKIREELSDCAKPFKNTFQMGRRFHIILEPIPGGNKNSKSRHLETDQNYNKGRDKFDGGKKDAKAENSKSNK